MKSQFLKISLFVLSLIVNCVSVQAQKLNPIKWTVSVEQSSKEVVLNIKATIEQHWHLYSQTLPEGGPIPTSFKIEVSDNFEVVGKVTEPDGKTYLDPNFEMELKTFDNEAVFNQVIKIKSNKTFLLKGSVEFMACNDKMCLPPNEVPFEITIKGK